MGTRADFYIGRGVDAEWIGSIAWDGYPEGLPAKLLSALSVDAFKAELSDFMIGRRDATLPADGWPWPWANSHTTDFAYAVDGGRVWASCFGHEWFDASLPSPEDCCEGDKVASFPDMSVGEPVLGERSGLLVFGK